MLFLPLRVDLDLYKTPVVTIAVCVLCTLIFIAQYNNESQVNDATLAFCEQPAPRMTQMVIERIAGWYDTQACGLLFWDIRLADDPDVRISEHVNDMPALSGMSASESRVLASSLLNERYTDFLSAVPDYKTQSLWYEPHSWNPLAMISAAFAHADWWHLIGNLFFFFAFAVAVEVIVGSLTLSALILAYAFGTHIFYSITMMAVNNPPPTVGLSGVVMAMIALCAYFLPRGRIHCFFWIFVFIRRFSLPIWVFALWFVGWDIFNLFNADEKSGINFVAHVSGAGLGYLTGMLLFRQRREEVRSIASGDTEDYHWVDEIKQIESLQSNKEYASATRRLQTLVDKYPHRESDLRSMRHDLLKELPLTPDREENARILMTELIDAGRLGKAVDIYLDRLADDATALPAKPEHYLPMLRLLKTRREYHAAVRMVKGFHKHYPLRSETPELYFEAAKIYQEELQQPEQVKRIADYLDDHFPRHPASLQVIEMAGS